MHINKFCLISLLFFLTGFLTGCGGGGTSSDTTLASSVDYSSTLDNLNCIAGTDSVGSWKTVANNSTSIPNNSNYYFFSYSQPSVNKSGLVTFRGRSKISSNNDNNQNNNNSTVIHGVYAVQSCLQNQTVYRVADNNMYVPPPNTTNVTFTEFPSIPRIDQDSGQISTRGMSQSLYILPDGTKIGNAGIYISLQTGIQTAIGQFGTIQEYSYMRVPNTTSQTPISFDQFPGSPTVTDNKVIFKGNYTDVDSAGASVSKTGIYYRDLNQVNQPVVLIVDTNTLIPGSSLYFGSTAPPSAALGKVVFVGVDNESYPSVGGIYMTSLTGNTSLNGFVKIGDPVPDANGNLSSNHFFTQFGEALSFDGRYVSFWGAWGTQQTQLFLQCPIDGNTALIDLCNSQSVNGVTTVSVPTNQGIFVFDSIQNKLWMVATTDPVFSDTTSLYQFNDFLTWTFSGDPNANDGEPPRWRASAFTSIDGQRGIIFKANLQLKSDTTVNASGIYGANLGGVDAGKVFKLISMNDSMSTLDPNSPSDSKIISLGIERESFRSGWLALSASSLNTLNESWAGVYVTNISSNFMLNGTVDQFGMASVVLK